MAMYDPSGAGAPFRPGKATAPTSKVEITVSCKNLRDRDIVSKSDPMCVLFMKDFGSPNFMEIGRSEVIKNNLNPEFAHKFAVDYRFEEAQKLKFEIYDVDSRSANLNSQDFLGRFECTLGEIVGANGGKVHKNLVGMPKVSTKLGTIIVSAEEMGTSKEVFFLQWKGEKLDKKDFLGKSDPFIQIYRILDDGSQSLVHRTEVIKNTLNPVWKPFKLRVNQLSGGNPDRPIRFDVYDWDDDGGQAHDLIGSFTTSAAKLQQQGAASQRVFELINPQKKAKKKDYKNSGTLHLMQFAVEIESTFLDYIRGGTQINFTVAVDFTASNGNPADPNSLHYIHPYAPNAYMVALKAVGEICQDYDSDKMFPALGFGAKLPPSGIVSHEFFLNFNPNDPYCRGIDGVMEAYKRALMSIQLYGPTNFSPVINHVARVASSATAGSNYFILLIITDGVITDIDNTLSAIVNASSLPMSIIIVGVGGADFAAMDFLDSDRGLLEFNGRKAERDIVQFVPFRNYMQQGGGNFELSQARLAKDVLAEVPQQFLSYMQKRNIKPKPPIQVDVSQMIPQNPTNVDSLPPGEIPPQISGGPQVPPPYAQGPPAQGGVPPQQYPPGGAPNTYQPMGGPGYPPNQPSGPGYTSGQPAYGPSTGYPQTQQAQPGYPQNPQAPSGPGYPQNPPAAYPQGSGYPSSAPPYQQQPSGQQSSGYPSQNAPPSGGYPAYGQQSAGYPSQNVPPSGGYPTQHQQRPYP